MDISGINYYRCVQVRAYIAHMEVDEDLKIKKKLIFPFIAECDLGFYGDDCKKPCDYPYYGENCVSMCICSKEECRFINGCRDHHIEGILLEINMLDHIVPFTV